MTSVSYVTSTLTQIASGRYKNENNNQQVEGIVLFSDGIDSENNGKVGMYSEDNIKLILWKEKCYQSLPLCSLIYQVRSNIKWDVLL